MTQSFDDSILRENLLKKLDLKSYDQLNKSKFAESVGLPHDSVKKLVSGYTKNPGIKTLMTIAQSFGCSVDELIGYKPKNHNVSKLVSQELTFNKKLFESTLIHTFLFIEKHNLSPSVGNIMYVLDNIYDYSFRRNLDQPDTEFSNWILNSNLKS